MADAPSPTAADESIGWNDAREELDAILRRLESGTDDVDAVAALVERAAVLITVCRTRLRAAQMRVDRVLAELDTQITDESVDE